MEEVRTLLADDDSGVRAEALESALMLLLLPRDPDDERNVLLEIRPGPGGEEAALFGGDLFRMYSLYAGSGLEG